MEPRACLDILFTVHIASEAPTNNSERDFLRWQFENKLICITMPASTTKQMYTDDRRAFETDQRWTAIDTYTTSYLHPPTRPTVRIFSEHWKFQRRKVFQT